MYLTIEEAYNMRQNCGKMEKWREEPRELLNKEFIGTIIQPRSFEIIFVHLFPLEEYTYLSKYLPFSL